MPANVNYGTGRRKSATARVHLQAGNGRITIDGVEDELGIAAWTRETEKAGKFLSLSIKLKTDGGRGEAHPGGV